MIIGEDGTGRRLLVSVREFLSWTVPTYSDVPLAGTLFHKRFTEAIALRKKHREIVGKLTATFSPQKIKEWEDMVTAWRNDKQKPRDQRTVPNPYKEPVNGMQPNLAGVA